MAFEFGQFFNPGVLSWMSVIYLDVVKSRIQADDPVKPYYKGTVDCFKKCYKVRINYTSVNLTKLGFFY